jgi:uncharacterized protein
MNGELASKIEQLKNNLKQMDSVAVAFSGGVDSTFLLKMAHESLGEKAIAVTAVSPVFPQNECKEAKQFTNNIGITHKLINSGEISIDNFSKNPTDRCYYCKKELFTKIKQIADKEKISFVLDGSNADDVNDYRPGFKALRELGIVSPLSDVGLTKGEIRRYSKEIGLDTWDKPAFACLASRFPYGIKITKEKLKMVEQAEDFVRNLGIKQFRVRFHEDIARIEVLKDDFQTVLEDSDEISKKFKDLGFKYVTLDIDGYRSGSLNEVISK